MNELNKAIKQLRNGDVVGIPTETVYGLAASIESPEGIDKIFTTKARPFFDPLIVHCVNIAQVKSYCLHWSTIHQKLAEKFWPGPMTLILDKSSSISEKITSGLLTVGMRIPNHPLALKLISGLGHPLAAPSANQFKKLSPTKAADVHSEFPNLLVMDGGPCEVGIESTILRVEGDKIIIYRPGMINKDQIESLFNYNIKVEQKQSPVAPGHMQHHYMPNKNLYFLFESDNYPPDHAHWALPIDANLAARELYSKIRELDQSQHQNLLITVNDHQLNSIAYRGIINRLIKASYLKSERIKPEY